MAASATSAARRTVGVQPAARLEGELRLPGDKSISHRALMLALLADGESRIRGAGDGADVRSTAGIVRALGASVERAPSAGDAGNVDYIVGSAGVAGIRQPDGPLECGNSGTSLRLFAGILAGQPVEATLDGDASLRSRPMARIIEPLRAMGASVDGDAGRPPLRVIGRAPLDPIEWTTPVPSAQVKSAVLLAGLGAGGTTVVHESVATRDHTERMLRARGVAVRSRADGGGGAVVEIDGGAMVRAFDEEVPGDPSAAAFWLVAGAIHRAAALRLRRVSVNPTRGAILDVLRRMGAAIDETPIETPASGEPIADLAVRTGELRAVELEPSETARAIDEIPILCLAATQARGRSVIRGAGELRHKESDRIAGIVGGLRELGARISVEGDDVLIDGPGDLRGATVDSLGDHRLALMFAIAGLVADGRTTILGADSVAISYPTFFADLERIRS
ncbi:MAG: 3-phosphoshikimate 1-carboxyvinyltransferase [Chloroflexi bacterium]|nr:MAG: 3-phosphoshikimate 1-carboxyvinyltransferase [Chloroflexota bacterium]